MAEFPHITFVIEFEGKIFITRDYDMIDPQDPETCRREAPFIDAFQIRCLKSNVDKCYALRSSVQMVRSLMTGDQIDFE